MLSENELQEVVGGFIPVLCGVRAILLTVSLGVTLGDYASRLVIGGYEHDNALFG